MDKATKELSMEKTLKELDKTWKEMEFESEDHTRTGLKLMKTSEELIEILEDNQVRKKKLIRKFEKKLGKRLNLKFLNI